MALVPNSLKRVALALTILSALVLGAVAQTSRAEAAPIIKRDWCVWLCDPR